MFMSIEIVSTKYEHRRRKDVYDHQCYCDYVYNVVEWKHQENTLANTSKPKMNILCWREQERNGEEKR